MIGVSVDPIHNDRLSRAGGCTLLQALFPMPRRRPTPSPPPSDDADTAPQAVGMRDMLIPYVLLAVSLQRAHGYLIEEYLRGLGFLGLDMSTLYRTLRQLEKDGLLC